VFTPVDPPYVTSEIVPEKLVSIGDIEVTMSWCQENGISFSFPGQANLQHSNLIRLSNFLSDVAENKSHSFDLDNQMRSIPLENFGFIQVQDFSTSETFWVSANASFPLAFGTPVLSWETGRDLLTRRPCAVLTLGAVGLPSHRNPLRASVHWNDDEQVEFLLARAQAIDTYYVEIALLDSGFVRNARTRWDQDERMREFVAQLPRSAHIKHSRIARILKNQHGSASLEQGSHGRRGHLFIIDFPDTRTVPIIALKNFDRVGVADTLAAEGVVPMPKWENDEFWRRLNSRVWTFWVTNPELINHNDAPLIGWLERAIQERCSFRVGRQTRTYPL